MPRTRLNRFGLSLTAIFQLLIPMFASVADARAEAASERAASVHVEAHSNPKCVPVHSAECVVCRVLTGTAAVSRPQAVRVAIKKVVTAPQPQYDLVALGVFAPGNPSQRAPPLV